MMYLKLARWPHWLPGLIALTGILYARKLFDANYLLISLYFFLPFLLAGIASELMISALSIQRKYPLLSAGEIALAKQFDWKILSLCAALLFTIAAVVANLYTKGLHSSWYILGMLFFSISYGLFLRKLWLIDSVSFPLLYLLPLVAGTLDTMLPLYATQIILVYSVGLLVCVIRLCCSIEQQLQTSGPTQFQLSGGVYDAKSVPVLLCLSVGLFACSLIYHVIDQAAHLGRTSLLLLPLGFYAVAHTSLRYRSGLAQANQSSALAGSLKTTPLIISLLLTLIVWSIAVHWRI